MTRGPHFTSSLFSDEAGSVIVELALVMSFLALLLLGGFEISRMATQAHEVEQIARAGAQWGIRSQSYAADLATVETKTRAAAGDKAEVIIVDASNYCLCPDGSSIGCSENCSGRSSQLYLRVVVTMPYEFVLNLQDVLGPVTLQGRAEVRVR